MGQEKVWLKINFHIWELLKSKHPLNVGYDTESWTLNWQSDPKKSKYYMNSFQPGSQFTIDSARV